MSARDTVADSVDVPTEDDVVMTQDGGADETEIAENGDDDTADEEETDETGAAQAKKFTDVLRSPIVELVVDHEEQQTVLHAHEALLLQSPYLAGLLSELDTSAPLRLPLTEDLNAVSSTLEFLYKTDYFPALASSQALEADPSIPSNDPDGIALLRHARIYTLAQKWSLSDLKALAHRKIHLVESTATGEIAYARYVYGNTSLEDTQIRAPVAQFWATRSHVLRHSAEQEFRSMCLDYPQFGFDVLSAVLDVQEKRSGKADGASTGTQSGRKRARVSQT